MELDEFLAKHGFPGTPAGDRMREDLESLLGEMRPGRWWRVLEADGSLWMETSSEEEARQGLRETWVDEEEEDVIVGDVVPGRKLQCLYEAPPRREWRDEK